MTIASANAGRTGGKGWILPWKTGPGLGKAWTEPLGKVWASAIAGRLLDECALRECFLG